MTDQAWRGATRLGVVKAGDLVAALRRVSTARSESESSLSGTMLCFAAEAPMQVWASDGMRLAITSVPLREPPTIAQWFSVVPAPFVDAMKTHFERADPVELGVVGEALLVRRANEQRTLVQPLWPEGALIDAYNAFVAGGAADGAVHVRGDELLARLGGVPARADATIAIARDTLMVLARGEGLGAPLDATVALRPQTLACDGAGLSAAIDAVVDLKLRDVTLQIFGERAIVMARGRKRGTADGFGAMKYYLRTGPSNHRTADPVPSGDHALPAPARLELPAVAEPVEAILAELDGIVGQPELTRQVRGILNSAEINRKRQAQGLKTNPTARHMVFTGPPGTGKTTVARLIARLYHALGLLERAEVKEVARSDLVSANVGGTEEKTAKAIDDAMGGVLFIDEAYTLAEGGDNDFGKTAIGVLLKELDDRRDGFVCIAAGYTEQMTAFLDTNPGMRSRLARTIDFVPYSPDDLVTIATAMARSRDNRLSEDGETELRRRLIDEERRGGFERRDWGNARSVRNIVESAATHRDTRISLSGAHDLDSLVTLTRDDIAQACDDFRIGTAAGRTETVDDVLAELDGQIGQPQLKQQIRAILAGVRVQQMKQEQGLQAGGSAIEHLLFVGPPGTGKTTVARLVARLYRALGVLPKEDIVEVDRQKLVAGYRGQTAILTTKKIDEAMGGVLFIDEAYALAKGDDHDPGREAISTLLPRLENDKGKFLAIAAGYPDDIAKFLEVDQGLKSRFTVTVAFLPYDADELTQIAEGMAAARGEDLTEGAREALRSRLCTAQKAGAFDAADWGNARSVRNAVDRAIQQRDMRISADDVVADPGSLVTITEADMVAACDIEAIAATAATESVEKVLAELDAQIGQDAVKKQVRSLVAQADLDKARKEAGLAAGPVPLEHLLFVGPPGTGKTTIARLIARLYRALGLLPKGHLVEVDREALVGQHIGSTAARTNARIDEAMGGVLFIDEAYALAKGSDNDFGTEALDKLVPRLDNDRGKFVAIAAGYPDDMNKLLRANVGLASRFSERIEFAPYSAEELVEIGRLMARNAHQQFDEIAVSALRTRLHAAERAGAFERKDWGNARQVRTVIEGAMKDRDLRVSTSGYRDSVELVTITAADIDAACDRLAV